MRYEDLSWNWKPDETHPVVEVVYRMLAPYLYRNPPKSWRGLTLGWTDKWYLNFVNVTSDPHIQVVISDGPWRHGANFYMRDPQFLYKLVTYLHNRTPRTVRALV